MVNKKELNIPNGIFIVLAVFVACATLYYRYKWETRNDYLREEIKELRKEVRELKNYNYDIFVGTAEKPTLAELLEYIKTEGTTGEGK